MEPHGGLAIILSLSFSVHTTVPPRVVQTARPVLRWLRSLAAGGRDQNDAAAVAAAATVCRRPPSPRPSPLSPHDSIQIYTKITPNPHHMYRQPPPTVRSTPRRPSGTRSTTAPVRARPGRSSGLRVSIARCMSVVILCGCGGRITALFGDFRSTLHCVHSCPVGGVIILWLSTVVYTRAQCCQICFFDHSILGAGQWRAASGRPSRPARRATRS